MITVLSSILFSVLNFTIDISGAPMLLTGAAALASPVVIYVTEFNEDSTKQFAEDIQSALDSKEPIIPIVISSYGGSIYAFLEMADIIQSLKVPIATICMGKCMSAGAMLLAMGTEGYRFAAPNATILIHDASTQIEGKVSDIINDTAEIVRLNELIFGMLAQQCKKPDNFFLKLLDGKGHIDLYLTASQAKDYGIVNHIRQPSIKVKVITQMSLE